MRVPHPIPYQGSKRKIAGAILRYIPLTTRLVEPFAGSAAISLAAAASERAEEFVINDLNVPLIALWDLIINHPLEISQSYERLWNEQIGREREFYDAVRDRFNETQRPDYFLYLLARCVKAAVRYNSQGIFNQSPDNRRRGVRPATMRRHIYGASELLKGRTKLQSVDYVKVLEATTEDNVIYMDPPYQGVSKRRDARYVTGLQFDEFVDVLSYLNVRKASYIISYDGRTGDRTYGKKLPDHLGLLHLEVDAGMSTQATLNGSPARTVESLYISRALQERMSSHPTSREEALTLFWDPMGGSRCTPRRLPRAAGLRHG